MDLTASSTCSQKAPRSAGSGNLSVARGVIWANMALRSLEGKKVAKVETSQGGVVMGWYSCYWRAYSWIFAPACTAAIAASLLPCSSARALSRAIAWSSVSLNDGSVLFKIASHAF
jgi:hypothetical protein